MVVLDESYDTTTFTRLRGKCHSSQRDIKSVQAGHWKTLTILGAITVDGVLAAATVDAAAKAQAFRTFIFKCLVPTLPPGIVVVMDILSAHKVSGIRDAIDGAAYRLAYLPPHSKDMSPIENILVNNQDRAASARSPHGRSIASAVAKAVKQITPADCRGCFDRCGYSPRQK